MFDGLTKTVQFPLHCVDGHRRMSSFLPNEQSDGRNIARQVQARHRWFHAAFGARGGHSSKLLLRKRLGTLMVCMVPSVPRNANVLHRATANLSNNIPCFSLAELLSNSMIPIL
jgi:hypothetical protein